MKVYGACEQVQLSHGYLVDDCYSGISTIIGTLSIDVDTTSIKQLKEHIEFNNASTVKRRSVMYQEAMFLMQRLPNIYNKSTSELNKYKLGLAKKGSSEVRVLVVASEDEVIGSLVSNIFEYDVVLIPFSQISDCD